MSGEEKRTEEDKLCRAPLKVWLGGEEREVRILSIKESREWRGRLVEVLSKLPQWINTTTDTPEAFREAMKAMLVEVPDLVSDLFFAYAKDLNKNEIEEVATDEELAKAFQEIATFALPLTGSLVQAMQATGPAPAKRSSSS